MRTYQQTHPFLTFSIEMGQAPVSLWMLLAECQSKCSHLAGTPLEPLRAERMRQVYLVKGALATNAIEGNTLSEEQVHQHLEGTLRLPPSQEYLEQEIENIISECNRIYTDIASGALPSLSVAGICDMNRAVLRRLSLQEGVIPGEIRTYRVGVGGYLGPPGEDCPYLLERLCDWLNGEEFEGPDENRVVYAILKAVVAHLYLVWIHPFGDGNGRTARLAEFQILISSGVPDPAAHLLSNHYNRTRAEYYRQLERSTQRGNGILEFVHYAVEGLRDGLVDQLEEIREQALEVAWRDFVNEKFRGRISPTDIRRKELVLALSAVSQGVTLFRHVPLRDIRAITPRLAEDYSGKTSKTITRDVNALVEMQLIEKTKDGVRARKEIMRAFLPLTARA